MRELSQSGSGGRTQIAKVRVARLAAKQWGRISRSQLAEIGVGKATIDRWQENAHLHRLLPSVYAVGHTAPSIEADLSAALLYGGEGAMLSHGTAVWWWELSEHPPATIEIIATRRRRPALGMHIHYRRGRARVWRNRLPVSTVEDALLDYAVAAPPARIRRALAEAEYRQLLNIEALDGALRRGRPGGAKLRAAVQRHRPALALTRSQLEQAFLELCERAGLPLPEVNLRLGAMTVDAAWPDERVVVELDGYGGHRTRAQLERDRRRELRLRAAGYTVVRYSWSQVIQQPDLVIADLTALLRAAA